VEFLHTGKGKQLLLGKGREGTASPGGEQEEAVLKKKKLHSEKGRRGNNTPGGGKKKKKLVRQGKRGKKEEKGPPLSAKKGEGKGELFCSAVEKISRGRGSAPQGRKGKERGSISRGKGLLRREKRRRLSNGGKSGGQSRIFPGNELLEGKEENSHVGGGRVSGLPKRKVYFLSREGPFSWGGGATKKSFESFRSWYRGGKGKWPREI